MFRKILPILMAEITGHARERVENLRWDKELLTPNLFRIWELIFWRRNGIRLESAGASCVDKFGNRAEFFIAYSREAKLAVLEKCFRNYISSVMRKIKKIKFPEWDLSVFNDVFTPQYAFANIAILPKNGFRPKGYMFAVALDTSGGAATSPGTTVSISGYTVTGSNIIMLCAAEDQANVTTNYNINVTSITCNTGGQSLVKRQVVRGDVSYGTNTSMWSKLGAASGNVLATRTTGGDGFQIGVETLSGVDQTVNESSIAMNSVSAGTFSSPQNSPAVTSPTNGWVAMSTYISIGAPAATAGTGTFLRYTGAEYGYLFDSNGLVSGSQMLQAVRATSASYGMVVVAVGPVTASVYTPKILQS